MSVVTIKPTDFQRTGKQQPLVIPLAGGKPVTYVRCTTFVGAVEDKYLLHQREKRLVGIGLSMRPDLLLSVSAHLEDKGELNRICDQAMEYAKANAAATTGTALHALAELVDRGQELPEGLREDVVASINAYREETSDLAAVHIERPCVQDFLQVGGTPDRVVRYQGKSYIADIKTGKIEFGTAKIAAQLAVYARSKLYDVTTGERTAHGAEIDKAIIIHLPAGEGTCRLLWVDLLEGWEDVQLSRVIRKRRRLKFDDLVAPFGPDLTTQLAASLPLDKQIEACESADAVRALWAEHADEWSDALTETARVHIAGMQEAS